MTVDPAADQVADSSSRPVQTHQTHRALSDAKGHPMPGFGDHQVSAAHVVEGEPRVHNGAECRAERLAVELGRVMGGERGESICRYGEQDVEATGFDRVDRLLWVFAPGSFTRGGRRP
jgi:hypothetical protein